jgi:hypothetical protein
MTSAEEYRSNAEDCMRRANVASEERDRPLWLAMAQSWLRLAELFEQEDPASKEHGVQPSPAA